MTGCERACHGDPFEWVQNGDIKCLKFFLEGGGDPNLISDEKGTLLIYAMNNKSLRPHEVLEVLLDFGADPNRACKGFDPPLVSAARWADEVSVKMLLDKGADKNILGVDGRSAMDNVGEGGAATARIRHMLKK